MIEFANPWFLLGLVVVPLALAWWLRRRRLALRFSDMSALAVAGVGRGRFIRGAQLGLRSIVLVGLIVALVGPRWPDRHTRIPTEGIAMEIVVDVSGSMAEPDFTWDGVPMRRLDAVKRVFHVFVEGGEAAEGEHFEGRPSDLIGLVTFATVPESACPPTLSHDVLARFLDRAQPRSGALEGRTNIGDAIAIGLRRLQAVRAPRKVMMLLSDGEHNIPPPALTPRQAAQLAANLHIPVYTIDAGGKSSVEEGISAEQARTAATIREAGVQSLQAVARMTGGKYFQARDSATLLTVCHDIDRLERQEIQSFIYQRYYDTYPWIGLAVLGCWALLFALELTVWRTLP